MPTNNSSIVSTLEIIAKQIQQKRGLFESYSNQSIEIIESYTRIGDFEEIEEQLEALIELQLGLIQQIEERNKHRTPWSTIDQEEAISFFRLISKIRSIDPKTFKISNSERYNEVISLLVDYSEAMREGDVIKAGGLARRINARFSQFTKDEYGENIIITQCFRLRKNNQDQQKVIRGFIKPAEIFSLMRKNKIDTRTLTEVPDNYKQYIQQNLASSGKMWGLITQEEELFDQLNSLVISYFKKSDIATEILRKVSKKEKV